MRPRTNLSRCAIVIATMLIGFAAPRAVAAQTQTWYANLTPEVEGATGTGFGLFTFERTLTEANLTIDVSWSGLSGFTTVAHIHCCTAVPNTGTVGVAVMPGTLTGFPTDVMSGSYLATIDLNLATSFTVGFLNNFGGGDVLGAQQALFESFDSGTAYFNIHTNEFPPGEIRGFITQVPEPSTLMLTMLGAAMLLVASLWRRMHFTAAAL